MSDNQVDYTRVMPYGDTMNDGKVQISFTLPVKNDERGMAAAKSIARNMGISEPHVAHRESLDEGFSFYVIYGQITASVDYTAIGVYETDDIDMDMDEINAFIREHIRRKVVVVGASIGDDAHTVGIDAIMNMKGYAGHYGLERYAMIEAYNLGSQVPVWEFVEKIKELKADVCLVSQTVTQKNIHIKTLTELVEVLEAENLRSRVVLCCGGARITRELAKELGYDAGFGPGKYAEDVAAFFVKEIVVRGLC